MFVFISHAWNKTMQGDFKSYFSIYGNRLLLIIVVDTPIIPKTANRNLTPPPYLLEYFLCLSKTNQKEIV